MTAETLIHPNYFLKLAHSLFENWGASEEYLCLFSTILVGGGTLFLAWLLYKALTCLVVPGVLKVVGSTGPKWDDILFNPQLLKVVAELLCVILLKVTLPESLAYYSTARAIAMLCCRLLLVWTVVHLVCRLLLAVDELLEHNSNSRVSSLKGIRQMLQVVTVCIGIVVTISILANKNPLIIVSGLGAAATVLMLVFKDSIMGMVAGVQLTLNDMLRPGDWISVPSRNINGVVQEVGLNTVKVQNFDMTIVTVPPYALVSESFQNWRGMYAAQGRRITRSVTIDINTVGFCTHEMVKKFRNEEWGRDLDLSERHVNLTVFRKYLEHYIAHLPTLLPARKPQTARHGDGKGKEKGASIVYMVRELEPTPHGIPVEIYLFTTITAWKPYEHLQADIMDHLLASVGQFGLRVYQAPSGYDVMALKQ